MSLATLRRFCAVALPIAIEPDSAPINVPRRRKRLKDERPTPSIGNLRLRRLASMAAK